MTFWHWSSVVCFISAQMVWAEDELKWHQLSVEQRTTLQPFAKDWDGLPNERRAQLLHKADGFAKMSPEQQ